PGQLRGPECKRVMQQAIVLRKKLEPWFGSIDSNDIQELCIILRVDGSLGSFGEEGVESVLIDDGTLECDVVIADRGWSELDDAEIAAVLREHVFEAISICFERCGISFDADGLATTMA
ncbi:MAG: hypothetical protein ACR2PA_18425, partial [Hyphomicrobiaceae bacterium]